MAQIYSFRQLEALYVQAGGSSKLAPVMAAIAKAESSGNPQARHINSNGSIDQGLWQINTSNSALYQGKNIYDPLENARVAVRLAEHSGNKLRNWTTYTSGAFTKFLPKAGAKVAGKTKGNSFGIYTQANYAGTDQGVDYRGQGAIPALGTGVVTDVGTSGIIEGGKYPYIVYRLTSGPFKGHFVYVAENFVPKVKVGTKLKIGQVIGIAPGKFPYTETGFNKTGKGWNPVAPLSPTNPHSATPAGSSMLSYIQGLEGQKHGTSLLGSAENIGSSALGVVTNPVGTVTGLVGSGVSAVTGGIGSEIDSIAAKILDAFAIIGGGVVFVLGFTLIAADVGLSTKAGKIAAAVPAGRIIAGAARSKTASTTSRRSQSSSSAAQGNRAEERREERHKAALQESASRTKKNQAQATESRTRQKNRRKTAKEQKAAETKSYYAGARDAASPTMAKIRKNRKK